MFSWKLTLIGIVPITGFGIGYPKVSEINCSEAKEIVQRKSTCYQVVEGYSENGDNTKQFLVCKKGEGEEVIFYLYNNSNKNKQEVAKLKVENIGDYSQQPKIKFTLVAGEGQEKTITLNYTWKYENEMDLKNDCQIDWEYGKISCSKNGQGPKKEVQLSPFRE